MRRHIWLTPAGAPRPTVAASARPTAAASARPTTAVGSARPTTAASARPTAAASARPTAAASARPTAALAAAAALAALTLACVACSQDQRQPPPAAGGPAPHSAGAIPRDTPAAPAASDGGISPQSSPAVRLSIDGARKIGQVVPCDGSCELPSLSPDSQLLTYGESPGMMHHPVFVLPAKRWRRGSSATMEDEVASGGGAHWMPDGKHLVLRSPLFEDEGGTGSPKLVIASTGGAETALKSARSSHDPRCPSPSPDGLRIVFDRAGKKGVRELAIVDVDNVGLAVLGPGECPEWSPDGHSIVFTEKGVLKAIDPAGGAARVLAAGPGLSGRPTFSPDGTFVVITRQAGDKTELVAVHADGSDAQPVVVTKKGGPFDPSWARDGFIYYISNDMSVERLEPIITAH